MTRVFTLGRVLVAASLLSVISVQAEAAGCIKGALVGGVAGHLAGHHGMMGAAAGCAVGHHMATKANATQTSAPATTDTTANPK